MRTFTNAVFHASQIAQTMFQRVQKAFESMLYIAVLFFSFLIFNLLIITTALFPALDDPQKRVLYDLYGETGDSGQQVRVCLGLVVVTVWIC